MDCLIDRASSRVSSLFDNTNLSHRWSSNPHLYKYTGTLLALDRSFIASFSMSLFWLLEVQRKLAQCAFPFESLTMLHIVNMEQLSTNMLFDFRPTLVYLTPLWVSCCHCRGFACDVMCSLLSAILDVISGSDHVQSLICNIHTNYHYFFHNAYIVLCDWMQQSILSRWTHKNIEKVEENVIFLPVSHADHLEY